MNAKILTPPLFGEDKDAAQKIGGERWMIEIPTVRVGPFKPVLVQHLGEAVKEHGVIRPNCVVGNCQFHRRREEGENDDEKRARITSGAHAPAVRAASMPPVIASLRLP